MRLVSFLAVACLLLPASAGAAGKEDGLARMAGIWQLDQRVSDDPRRELGAALRELEGRPVPDGDSGRARRDRRRGESGSASIEGLRDRAEAILEGAQVLTLEADGEVLTIVDWHDRRRTLHVDGKKLTGERGGVPVDVKSSWRSSDRLVVETTGGPGGKTTEIFELGDRGTTLFVEVLLEVKGRRLPYAFERVYHRIEADR